MLYHLVLTRFSVNTALAGRMRRMDANDQYLEYRLRLFELFCLPSMQAQTNQNFKWFVFFGADTPDWLRIRLDEWEKDEAFIPTYSHTFRDALDTVKHWININTNEGDQVLTTRLDNDDAFSCHMVDRLQAAVDPSSDLQYFCPPRGQQVVVKSDNPQDWRFYSMKYLANPFVSMMERVTEEPPLLIYHRKHGSIKQKALGMPVIRIPHASAWMQILHGKNLGNGLWTRQRARPDFNEFPFLEPYFKGGVPEELRRDRNA